jgi:hypothetical protein
MTPLGVTMHTFYRAASSSATLATQMRCSLRHELVDQPQAVAGLHRIRRESCAGAS